MAWNTEALSLEGKRDLHLKLKYISETYYIIYKIWGKKELH